MNDLTNYNQDMKEVNKNDHSKKTEVKKDIKKPVEHTKEGTDRDNREKKDRNERNPKNDKSIEGEDPKNHIKELKNPHDAEDKHYEDDKTGTKGSSPTLQPAQNTEVQSGKTEFNDDERLQYVPGESEAAQSNDDHLILDGHDQKKNQTFI